MYDACHHRIDTGSIMVDSDYTTQMVLAYQTENNGLLMETSKHGEMVRLTQQLPYSIGSSITNRLFYDRGQTLSLFTSSRPAD